ATMIGRLAFVVAWLAICAFNVWLLYALWFRPIGEWNVYELSLMSTLVANSLRRDDFIFAVLYLWVSQVRWWYCGLLSCGSTDSYVFTVYFVFVSSWQMKKRGGTAAPARLFVAGRSRSVRRGAFDF